MFDRDVGKSDLTKPGPKTEKVRKQWGALVESWPTDWRTLLPYLLLGRRAIENYVFDDLFAKWQNADIARRDQVHALQSAERMKGEVRWYWHVREGLKKDLLEPDHKKKEARLKVLKNDPSQLTVAELPPLYCSLSPHELRHLCNGFGPIATLFEPAYRQQSWFDSGFEAEYQKGPAGQPSRQDIAQAILARI